MGGVDAIVFTAGVGENSPAIRERSCRGLEFLGVELDEQANRQAARHEALISKPEARVKVFVIPTNEELVIATDTETIVRQSMQPA